MALGLIAAAYGVGRAAYGMYRNRKETRRRKSLINEAYQNSHDRLETRQADVRQGSAEALNARGLLQGGGAERIDQATDANSIDPHAGIREAAKRGGMMGKMMTKVAGKLPAQQVAVRTPTTLAGQQTADMEGELGLERRDLDFEKRKAMSDAKSAGQQGTLDAIGAGIDAGVGLYNAGKNLSAIKQAMMADQVAALPTDIPEVSQIPNGTATPPKLSPIKAAMTGVENSGNWFGGINGLDPFSPGSSWNRDGQTVRSTVLGYGQSNAEFNV